MIYLTNLKSRCQSLALKSPMSLSLLYMILKQIDSNEPELSNSYTRAVKEEGNEAREIINKVFEVFDSEWLRIGTIEKSGNTLTRNTNDRMP